MSMTSGAEHDSGLAATILHPGEASGRLLVLGEPVSFWGGVSAEGTVIDAHHPQRGASVVGAVLAMRTGRGSSSASSVLAEQIRSGHAPAAIIVTEPDVILVLGAAVAAELYGTSMPIVQVTDDDFARIKSRAHADADSTITIVAIDGAERRGHLLEHRDARARVMMAPREGDPHEV